MEEQTWNYSGEFLKRAKIIISDKQILLENRELSFMRFPCRFIYGLFGVFPTFVSGIIIKKNPHHPRHLRLKS